MTNPIGYVDETWNPIVGCSPIGEGCKNCWARRMARRLAANPKAPPAYKTVARWGGRTALSLGSRVKTFSGRKPKRIAVCFMGDLFHESTPDEWIHGVMHVISEAPRHTFLLLTKRAQRVAEYTRRYGALPANAWAGVSVSNQHNLDQIAPDLLAVSAAVRWLSVEPMLGPIDLSGFSTLPDWIVFGPETGPGARPFERGWATSLAFQCEHLGIPCWDKRGILRQELPR